MTTGSATAPKSARWVGQDDGWLELLDQTLLPSEIRVVACRDVETVWEAIKKLRVRGAPAIGIAAAYGVCVGTQTARNADVPTFYARLKEVSDYLAGSRPTAVNLFWALKRMERVAEGLRGQAEAPQVFARLLAEAREIEEEDRRMCQAIGQAGAALIAPGSGVLTHCNTGGLATADFGTALAVIYFAHQAGKDIQVFADETRPLLQGARLTAWELQQWGVPVTLICDSAAAQVMREGRVQAIITGADRIAANGDTANKIGTYSLAVLAAAHAIPFYVAAPSSTFDLSLADGTGIPIEQRDPREVTHGFGKLTAPEGIGVYNPAFDVTPGKLIRALITERGVIEPVTTARIAEVLKPLA